MRVLIAAIADSSERTEDGKWNISGISSQLIVDDYPTSIDRHIVIRLDADAHERAGKTCNLLLIQRHEDGENIDRFGPFEVEVRHEGGDQEMQLYGLKIPRPGRYLFAILVDGTSIIDIPFLVDTTETVIRRMKAHGIDMKEIEIWLAARTLKARKG